MSIESKLHYHSKAQKALELAKKAEAIRLSRGQKAIKIPNGVSGDMSWRMSPVNRKVSMERIDLEKLNNLLVDGEKAKEIAKKMKISEATVFRYKKNLK